MQVYVVGTAHVSQKVWRLCVRGAGSELRCAALGRLTGKGPCSGLMAAASFLPWRRRCKTWRP